MEVVFPSGDGARLEDTSTSTIRLASNRFAVARQGSALLLSFERPRDSLRAVYAHLENSIAANLRCSS
jgi:hypothetical protein